jgi:hypothetical protein
MTISRAAGALLAVAAGCADADAVRPDGGIQAGDPDAAAAGYDGAFLPRVDARPCDGFDYKGHCYSLHVTTANIAWTAAKTACENLQPGAHLVTFETAEEAEYVPGALKPQKRGWIGLSDRATESTFMWVTGEPVAYTNWRTSEPSNGGASGNEDCGTYGLATELWAWNDLDCAGGAAGTFGYICEVDM